MCRLEGLRGNRRQHTKGDSETMIQPSGTVCSTLKVTQHKTFNVVGQLKGPRSLGDVCLSVNSAITCYLFERLRLQKGDRETTAFSKNSR